MMRLMPIWVTFSKLSLHLWGAASLGKIASAIRVSITTDECTAKKWRISYARVLIEVDITSDLQDSIRIRDDDGVLLVQNVQYEWLPNYRKKCHKLGHVCTKEKTLEAKASETDQPGKAIWKPKERLDNPFSTAPGKGKEKAGVAGDQIGKPAAHKVQLGRTHEASSVQPDGSQQSKVPSGSSKVPNEAPNDLVICTTSIDEEFPKLSSAISHKADGSNQQQESKKEEGHQGGKRSRMGKRTRITRV